MKASSRWLSLIVCFWAQQTWAQLNTLRLCVPESLSLECQRMQVTVGSSRLQCVLARDRLDCMEVVRRGQADLVKAHAEDIYTAGHEFGLAPYVMEEVGRGNYEYRSAAVVPRSSSIRSLRDLKGKRACMDRCTSTGLYGTRSSDTGWHMPVAALLDRRIMDPDCRGELYTVARFFNGACAQGAWTKSPIVDQMLKSEFPKLCSQCSDPATCSSSPRGTSEGSSCGPSSTLECLAESRGDVAFVDPQDVTEFLQKEPDQRGALEFLCLDGTRRPLRDIQDGGPGCVWNQRPSAVFMGDPDKTNLRYGYARSLRQAFQNHRVRPPSWFRRILATSEDATDLLPVPDHRDAWNTYLGSYRVPLEKELTNCETKILRLCVTSDEDAFKCGEWSKAAFPRRMRPRLRCERRDSKEECIESVAHRQADLLVLPASDAYRQAKSGRLSIIASEVFEESKSEEEGERRTTPELAFAVAVVKRDSDIHVLEDLRGKKSCHSGVSDPAGWDLPMSVLLETGTLNESECDRVEAISQFFSGGSCAPGAENGSSLCVHCKGDEDSFSTGRIRCDPKSDRYAGDEGAFRCLAEGAGDVAFVQHWVPIQFASKGANRRQQLDRELPRWARHLRPEDFLLLCPPQEQNEDQLQSSNGAKTTGASLAEYRRCNWGRLPPSYVMISTKASDEVIQDAAIFLAEASRAFAPGSEGAHTFRLFGGTFHNSTSQGVFFESASGLDVVSAKTPYQEVMDQKVLQVVQSTDSEQCSQKLTDEGVSVRPLSFYCLLMFLFVSKWSLAE